MVKKAYLSGKEKKKMNRNVSGGVKAFVFERDQGKCVYCGSSKNLENYFSLRKKKLKKISHLFNIFSYEFYLIAN